MFSWPQDFATNFQFLLRWIHFLAGITWIGMLYFFNLVNVQFQKELDAATKGKVIPILHAEGPLVVPLGRRVHLVLGLHLLLPARRQRDHRPHAAGLLSSWAGRSPSSSIAALYRAAVAGGPLKDGRVLAVAIAVVVIFIGYATALMARNAGSSQPHDLDHGRRRPRHDHVLERLDDHLAAPEEDHRGDEGDRRDRRRRLPPSRPKWARRAFLASRTNAWLSIPMLFFMGAASHFPIFSTLEKVVAP